jgi:hypothetical protein
MSSAVVSLCGDAALYSLDKNMQPDGISLNMHPYTLHMMGASAVNLNCLTHLSATHTRSAWISRICGHGVAHAMLLLNNSDMLHVPVIQGHLADSYFPF